MVHSPKTHFPSLLKLGIDVMGNAFLKRQPTVAPDDLITTRPPLLEVGLIHYLEEAEMALQDHQAPREVQQAIDFT